MLLVIRPSGQVDCLYDKAIDLTALGKLAIQRASHVEPDDLGRCDGPSAREGAVIGPFTTPRRALDAERQWLKQNRSSTREEHDSHTFARSAHQRDTETSDYDDMEPIAKGKRQEKCTETASVSWTLQIEGFTWTKRDGAAIHVGWFFERLEKYTDADESISAGPWSPWSTFSSNRTPCALSTRGSPVFRAVRSGRGLEQRSKCRPVAPIPERRMTWASKITLVDLGNSNTGPIGMVLRLNAADREASRRLATSFACPADPLVRLPLKCPTRSKTPSSTSTFASPGSRQRIRPLEEETEVDDRERNCPLADERLCFLAATAWPLHRPGRL